jgi:hypothetical protein
MQLDQDSAQFNQKLKMKRDLVDPQLPSRLFNMIANVKWYYYSAII